MVYLVMLWYIKIIIYKQVYIFNKTIYSMQIITQQTVDSSQINHTASLSTHTMRGPHDNDRSHHHFRHSELQIYIHRDFPSP